MNSTRSALIASTMALVSSLMALTVSFSHHEPAPAPAPAVVVQHQPTGMQCDEPDKWNLHTTTCTLTYSH